MAGKVIPLTPHVSRPVAIRKIRELATDSANVIQGPEYPSRAAMRKLNWHDVLKTLQKGNIVEGPYLDQKGCWRCRMERFAAGEELAVVVAICEQSLIVITAY